MQPAVLRKLLSNTHPGAALPLPRPPKKKDQQPPPKRLPSSLSSPVRCRRDRSHRQSPSANPVQRTSAKGSTPRTSKRPRVDAIKNALFESSCHCAGTGRARSNNLPRRNATATCARAMGQDYPSTGPSPGANPPIYPSSLPLACGNPLSNIFSKGHGFFSFCLYGLRGKRFWWRTDIRCTKSVRSQINDINRGIQ